ncbi:MAG: IS66 family insertion sequence element accessory protein TnpB [Lachnospiraceae bacterium]|nr:IS66 family insertion sequence element accessory protein TnpB [Lachnospiraceae bacterium]
MSNPRPHRTKDEWYALIQECRKSGMTDAQWCLANGISRHTFNNAIKRLRNCAYAIPSKKPRDIYDLTCPAQDVVKVDIVPDVQPVKDPDPETALHFDNSHMIEITFGDVHISLDNGADPVLVSKTLSILRSYT